MLPFDPVYVFIMGVKYGFGSPRWLPVLLPHCTETLEAKIFLCFFASMQLSVSCRFGPIRCLLIGFNTPALTSLLPSMTEPVCAVIFMVTHTLISIFTACLVNQLTKCKSILLLS